MEGPYSRAWTEFRTLLSCRPIYSSRSFGTGLLLINSSVAFFIPPKLLKHLALVDSSIFEKIVVTCNEIRARVWIDLCVLLIIVEIIKLLMKFAIPKMKTHSISYILESH